VRPASEHNAQGAMAPQMDAPDGVVVARLFTHLRAPLALVSRPHLETRPDTPRRVLAFAAVFEVGTGLALMIDPAIVVTLLLGVEVSGTGTLLGRCFGIALLALGLACWPGRPRSESGSPAFRAMLAYNVLIALYLAYLGTVVHLGGLLLWPGAALHAAVGLLLLLPWADERLSKTTNK
jgi:hypothetical protein